MNQGVPDINILLISVVTVICTIEVLAIHFVSSVLIQILRDLIPGEGDDVFLMQISVLNSIQWQDQCKISNNLDGLTIWTVGAGWGDPGFPDTLLDQFGEITFLYWLYSGSSG